MKINEDLLPIIVSRNEPINNYRKHIWIQNTENLMDLKSMFGNTSYFSISGNAVTVLRDDDRSWISAKEGFWGIKLQKGSYTLKLSKVITRINYGINGAAAGGIDNSDTFTFYVNADNTLVNFKLNDTTYPFTLNWVMLNTGNTAKTFTSYVDPKIYILNDSGRYEKTISAEYNKKYIKLWEINVTAEGELISPFTIDYNLYDHFIYMCGSDNEGDSGIFDVVDGTIINPILHFDDYANDSYFCKGYIRIRSNQIQIRTRQLKGWTNINFKIWGVLKT